MSSFKSFCEVCEAIKSTGSKLRKVKILAEYLKTLDSQNLPFVCRILSGHIFPPWSEKEVYIGYSSLIKLIMDVSGASNEEFKSSYIKHGDLGMVAEELFAKKRLVPLILEELTLNRIQNTFDKIALVKGDGSVLEKKNLLKGLFLNCSPLEAKYLVKILTNELRIGLVGGLVEESIAKAFNYKIQDVRDTVLTFSDIGEAALQAYYGKLHDLQVKLFHPLSFMLADTMQTAEEIAKYYNKELYAEFKYDGVRAQAHCSKGFVKIYSRRLEEISKSFPEVVDALSKIDHECILDGEIIPFKDGKVLPFQKLQHRLRRKIIDTQLIQEVPLIYFVYDLMYLDGKTLINETLEVRRRLLESLKFYESIKISQIFKVKTAQEIQELFNESKRLGYEGLVLKDPLSPYSLGKRGKLWVKLKKELDTLDVVIVMAEYGHGKRAGLLSDYTFAVRDNEGRLRVIGKAYSGLTDDEIVEMTERLKKITIKDYGFRRSVSPEIVLEVAFDSIQKSDRYDSGYALRFPRIKRIRYDKSVDEIDTLDRVKEIYEKQSYGK
ncbi:MAG: ATP-dependent DNA ligase [Nitrososphaerales archaeon]